MARARVGLRRTYVSRGSLETAAGLGREVAEAIVTGGDDYRVLRQDDGAVRVNTAWALYAYPGMGSSGYDAVRRAFTEALERRLSEAGWRPAGHDFYRRGV